MAAAWARARSGVPELLAGQMTGTLAKLATAAAADDPVRTGQAALGAEQAALDLRLRHRPPAEVDLTRLDLWARRLLADAAAKDRGAVAGDVATLQVLWNRAGHAADPAAAGRVAAALAALPRTIDSGRPLAAAAAVPALRDALGRVGA